MIHLSGGWMPIADRAAVAAAMRARRIDLEAAIIASVSEALPAYRSLSAEQTREIAAIASWALDRMVTAWHTGTGLDEHDLARFRGIGAARAEDGRPLPAVLRAYRVAAITGTDALIDLGGERLKREDVRDLTRVVL